MRDFEHISELKELDAEHAAHEEYLKWHCEDVEWLMGDDGGGGAIAAAQVSHVCCTGRAGTEDVWPPLLDPSSEEAPMPEVAHGMVA